jgi:hypothetical protein
VLQVKAGPSYVGWSLAALDSKRRADECRPFGERLAPQRGTLVAETSELVNRITASPNEGFERTGKATPRRLAASSLEDQ